MTRWCGTRWAAIGAASFLLLACFPLACAETVSGSAGAPAAQPAPTSVLSPATTAVTLEVAYQKGAEPATSDQAAPVVRDPWQIAATNLARLLPAKDLSVPHTLGEMTALDAADRSAYSRSDLLAIADAHRHLHSSGASASYFVLWVDALYVDSGTVNPDVLGASFDGTGVVALFMPALRGASAGETAAVARFMEQSSLIHELGHALGLVGDGVTATTPHQDTGHGAHCANPSCVMYWQNEGREAAVAFARQVVRSQNEILFDGECLRDIDAVTGH